MTEMDFNAKQIITYAADPRSFSEPHRQAIEAFLKANAEAARMVATYRLAHSRTFSDDSVAASSSAIERARAIFAQNFKAVPSESLLDRVQEFIARLVYDSRVQPAAVRSAGVQDQVLLTFESETGEIEIEARRSIDHAGVERWRMLGQVSGDLARTARSVELQSRGSTAIVALASLAGDGVFELDAPGGQFSLSVRTESGKVLMPEIDLS